MNIVDKFSDVSPLQCRVMIGNDLSELGSLTTKEMIESQDNRGRSIQCKMAVPNHQKQGRL